MPLSYNVVQSPPYAQSPPNTLLDAEMIKMHFLCEPLGSAIHTLTKSIINRHCP